MLTSVGNTHEGYASMFQALTSVFIGYPRSNTLRTKHLVLFPLEPLLEYSHLVLENSATRYHQ